MKGIFQPKMKIMSIYSPYLIECYGVNNTGLHWLSLYGHKKIIFTISSFVFYRREKIIGLEQHEGEWTMRGFVFLGELSL